MAGLSDYILDAKKRGYSRQEIIELFSKKGYSKKEIENELNNLERPKSKSSKIRGQEIDYFERAKLLLSEPKGFFEKIKDKNIKRSAILLLISLGILLLLEYILGLIFSSFNGLIFTFFSYGVYLFIMPFYFGLTFAFSGLQHLVVRLMKGKGNYFDTYNILAYSSVPSVLLLIIPVIGYFSFIYSIVLQVFGFKKYHNLTTGRAVLLALIPLILMILLLALLILLVIWTLSGISF